MVRVLAVLSPAGKSGGGTIIPSRIIPLRAGVEHVQSPVLTGEVRS